MQQIQIDQEVRIRLLEKLNQSMEEQFNKIDAKFDKIESKIDSHFLWMIGFIFVSIITPVILHSMKLV